MRHEEGATHAADGWARITGKVFSYDLGIVSDAKPALELLLRYAHETATPRSPDGWVRTAQESHHRLERKMDFDQAPITPQRIFKELNEFFPRDAIFVTSIGLSRIWSGQFQDMYQSYT